MSKFTIALQKNDDNSYELHANDGKEKHKILITNMGGNKTHGCRLKVKEKELIVENGVVERASLSIRLLLEKKVKNVKEIGIKENEGTYIAYSKIAVDFRERHGMQNEELTFILNDTYVSFHVEKDEERGMPVYYLIINSRPEM